MTGSSDQFTSIGVESAWGTIATTRTRGIYADPAKPTLRNETRGLSGLRPGFLGDPEDTWVTDVRGGSYELACDLLGKSHSMVLAMAGSAPTITTPSGATNARLHTILPSDYALRSHTVIDAVAVNGSTIDYAAFLGCIATGLSLSVAPKGNIKVKADLDFKTLDTAASSVTPSYPSSPYVFRDTDVTTTLGGTDICQTGIDVMIPTQAKIDRDRICAGGREEPIVQGRVRPTGTLNFDALSFDYIDDWVNGTSRSLVFYIEGPEIESGKNFFLRLTFAAVKFLGDLYDRKVDDATAQALPWQAVDNSADPLWKIEYQTTDTSA